MAKEQKKLGRQLPLPVAPPRPRRPAPENKGFSAESLIKP